MPGQLAHTATFDSLNGREINVQGDINTYNAVPHITFNQMGVTEPPGAFRQASSMDYTLMNIQGHQQSQIVEFPVDMFDCKQ